MSHVDATEIRGFALAAGFTPDQATTMTAIALAESGGNTRAHATGIEDSRGLWQINVQAHPEFADVDLYDPAQNAKAAYAVFHGAHESYRPWSVTHENRGEPYKDYLDEAKVAAQLGGEPAAERSALDVFMSSACAQEGDKYVFGAPSASFDNADPKVFDCSELVRWAAGRAGVELHDGSWQQYLELKSMGAAISVDEAAHTPGALLFRFSSEPTAGGARPSSAHVAISMGDGRTIEAKGRAYGVVHDDVAGRGFDYAAVIPGISQVGDQWSPGLAVPTGTTLGAADEDQDGLSNEVETAHGLDPSSADSDADGASDGYELVKLGTDPLKADTDKDGIADTLEAGFGTDPVKADTDGDGLADGQHAGARDTDQDGLSDRLEHALGTEVRVGDSDHDGISDQLEVAGHLDPLDPHSTPFAT